MSTTHYKGFSILTQPYLLHESRRWTADVEIRRAGRSQPIALGERYLSEQEAEAHSSSVARLVIDGGLPKWSLDGLRGSTRHRWGALRVILPSWSHGSGRRRPRASRTLTHSEEGRHMRPSLIAGILLLIVGTFILVRGGSFTTRENVLSVGDLKVSAEERQTIPTWVGAGALVAGVVVIVAGMRKRS